MILSITKQQIGYSCVLYIAIHTIINFGLIYFTKPFKLDDLLGFFFLPFGTILFVLMFVHIINKIIKIDNWSTLFFFAFFVAIMECLTYLMIDTTFLLILFDSNTEIKSAEQIIVLLVILNNYLSLVISMAIVKMILHFKSQATNSRLAQ